LRIGINVGDVIVDGDDLHGDGVNIAARLEGIAEPGGITISRTARDQIKGKLALGLDDLGQLSLKNIPEAVRAFRVRLDGEAAAMPAPTATAAQGTGAWQAPALAAGLAIALIVGGLALWRPWVSAPAPQTAQAPAPTPRPVQA